MDIEDNATEELWPKEQEPVWQSEKMKEDTSAEVTQIASENAEPIDWPALIAKADTHALWSDSVEQSVKHRDAYLDEVEAGIYRHATDLGIVDQHGNTDPARVEKLRAKVDEIQTVEGVLQQVHREALAAADAASTFDTPELPYGTLAEALQADIPPTQYRVEGLLVDGGNALLAAKYKAGKTTAVMDLSQSFCDGRPFLGQKVKPVKGRVVYWDAELETGYAIDQFRKLNFQRPDRLVHVPVKGYSLPITTTKAKDWAINMLKAAEAEVWIIDTFGKIFDGDENSNSEVRAWLHAVDEIKRLAGVSSVILVTHTGHAKEGQSARARGASYFGGWSDANWNLERTNDDASTVRSLKVNGRGDLVSEIWFDYSPETHTYTVVEEPLNGNKAKANDSRQQVFNAIMAQPGKTAKALADLTGLSRPTVTRHVNALVESGEVLADDSGAYARYRIAPLV